MFTLLENVKEVAQAPSTWLWLEGYIVSPAVIAVLVAIVSFFSKRFPVVRSVLEVICKTLFGELECKKNKEKSKKVKSNKK